MFNMNVIHGYEAEGMAGLFPWMTLALRAHWEIANKHVQRLFNRVDVQSEAMEDTVLKLEKNGIVEKEQATDFMRKNLGFIRYSPHGSPTIPVYGGFQSLEAL